MSTHTQVETTSVLEQSQHSYFKFSGYLLFINRYFT